MDTVYFGAIFAMTAVEIFSREADMLLCLVYAPLMENRDDWHASKSYLTLSHQ